MTKNKSLPKVLSSTERYIQEIQQYPLLRKEEEFELAVQYYKHKDLKAAHRMVTANLRFVIKIANEYANYGLQILDIIQEGNIGLMRAVKTYNPYKDTRLITYAVWWIRSYIHDYIQRNWSLVKMGTTQAQRKLFYRLKKEQKALEQLEYLSSTEKIKRISKALGVKEKEVIEMNQRLAGKDFSLDTPIASDNEKTTHLHFIADEKGNVEQVLQQKEEALLLKRKLEAFEKELTKRDHFIFQKRMIAEKQMTLQAIADKYKISKQRARHLEEKIKNSLKKFLTP